MGCDVYCALCGGPTVYVRIDDKSRKAKLREKREEALRAGMDVDSVQEEKISYDCGYDPEVVSRADVEWARWSVVLGFNPESTHVQKMFLSSSGTYEDYGFITGLGNCDDPNFPEDCTELQCYDTYDANQPPSFPMHKPCLQLFRKNILLKTGTDSIDKDLLYHIMLDLYKHGGRCGLPLDYGEVAQEHDQYWQSLPGEELMAINPTPMPPALEPLLRDTISAAATTTPTAPPAPLSLDAKVLRDPFAALPYDLHHEVLTHLGPDPAAVLALRTASWPVHAAVRAAPAFWRRALHASMPWFGELHAAAEERTEDVDWQTLFRRAEAQTRPVRGVEGAWMGVANRRRVWGACEQLAAVYVPRLIAQEREERREGGDGRDAEARAIWEGAENLMMPVVVSPMPERGVQTAWRQWVRSFEEVGAQDVGFETVWDGEGSLVGVGVTVSGSRRLFGKDVEGEGMKKGAVTIEKGHWITGLVLHLPDMCLANHPPGRLRNTIKWKEEKLSASIKGVTVITTAGNQKLGDTNPEYNQRLLPVSEGKTLVGVVGHISGTGAIARIGLVQAARPLPNSPPPPADEDDDDEEEETPRYPLLHRMLWKPTPLPPAWGNAIWAHPSLRALPYTTDALNRYQIQASIHEDLVPAEPLIWGATRDELRALRRVECYQREDGRDICGFRVVLEGQVEGRVVGNARAVGEKGDEVDEKKVGGEWPVRDVVGLGVDGAGGEVVVAVEVMRDEAIKAVKLRTNRGREVYWGERNINNRPFDSMVAPEGEMIVGIAVGFGYQGGFSWANERYSYSTMSWIAALTMPL